MEVEDDDQQQSRTAWRILTPPQTSSLVTSVSLTSDASPDLLIAYANGTVASFGLKDFQYTKIAGVWQATQTQSAFTHSSVYENLAVFHNSKEGVVLGKDYAEWMDGEEVFGFWSGKTTQNMFLFHPVSFFGFFSRFFHLLQFFKYFSMRNFFSREKPNKRTFVFLNFVSFLKFLRIFVFWNLEKIKSSFGLNLDFMCGVQNFNSIKNVHCMWESGRAHARATRKTKYLHVVCVIFCTLCLYYVYQVRNVKWSRILSELGY